MGDVRGKSALRMEREFTSSMDDLDPMRMFVRAACAPTAAAQLPARWMFQLELAINEAASNIIRHALDGKPDQPIHLHADVHEDHIVLRILHRGRAFDRSKVPPPAFDGSRDGGFGVYIIEQSVDHVEYSRDSDGLNCIQLTKKFIAPPPIEEF